MHLSRPFQCEFSGKTVTVINHIYITLSSDHHSKATTFTCGRFRRVSLYCGPYIADTGSTNVVLTDKTQWMSSTVCAASYAVDGAADTCTATAEQTYPYLVIDMGVSVSVHTLEVDWGTLAQGELM